MMNKIHIIGSVGSGKTTLARRLSKELNIPFYELDNVVWERGEREDRRRSPEERDELLLTIIRSEQWIIEGVHLDWVGDSFQQADLIILVDPPYRTRQRQIIKRFFKQRMKLEASHYKPTFTIFRKMIEWNKIYETKNRQEILEALAPYKDKLLHTSNNKDVMLRKEE